MDLDVGKHRTRAQHHKNVGDALLGAADEEWAAVCFFYCAYHLVRAALKDDPIFDDWEICQRKSPDLLPDDRHTSRHKGRKRTASGREWGVNDLVSLLYPSVAGTYDRLHQASNDVRYGDGLRPGATPAVIRQLLERVEAAAARGALATTIAVDDPRES